MKKQNKNRQVYTQDVFFKTLKRKLETVGADTPRPGPLHLLFSCTKIQKGGRISTP